MRYILRRVLSAIPVLLAVVFLIFVLTRIMPGDPARMYAGEQASAATLEAVRAQMGLDKSLPVQFVNYIQDLLRGDFGFAWHTGRDVIDDFAQRFPASLELAIFSLLLAVIIGIPLGIVSATRKNSPIDHTSRILSLIGASMPVFWMGLMLMIIFYANLGWAPAPVGRISKALNTPTSITGMYVLDSLLTGDWVAFKSSLSQMLLPGITLSFTTLAILSRMTRSSMLEVLNLDYVRTARAKGLKERTVVLVCGLANSLIPILTVLGAQFGVLLSYTVVVETIYSWPGIGSYLTDSILITDYAPVQAFALLAAIFYVILNLVLDILYTVVDPRVRYD